MERERQRGRQRKRIKRDMMEGGGEREREGIRESCKGRGRRGKGCPSFSVCVQ